MNILLFISFLFIFTFIAGMYFEKWRIPWLFSALLFGVLVALHPTTSSFTTSESFVFLANLGMYFLLFIIGLEIDMETIKKQGVFILTSTLTIIGFEGLLGAVVIHILFQISWFISIIVAISFATVGEAILVPILDEFRLMRTRLGQLIIGIGTLDDIVEIIMLALVSLIIIPDATTNAIHVGSVAGTLFILFALTALLTRIKKKGKTFTTIKIETLFLFIVSILFIFLGIGMYAHATPLAAILAGIALNNFIPRQRLKVMEKEIKTISYGFFAPFFFAWAGASIDLRYLFAAPLALLAIVAVSSIAKIVGSWLSTKNYIGTRNALLLGIGLSVRFSTSIVILKLLFEYKIIGSDLYSAIVASSIVFVVLIPLVFSRCVSTMPPAKKNA